MPEPPNPIQPPSKRRRTLIFAAPLLVGVALIVANCDRGKVSKSRETHLLSFGYLSGKELPDSLSLVGPPPADGSPAMQRDEQARLAALSGAGGARTAQAARDSVLAFPQAAQNFSCALGVGIDKDRTPHLYNMMAKMLIDVRASAYRAKNQYKRVRPFVAHQARSCAPEYAEMIRTDGSYPSAQSATGWVYAQVLSELQPSRIDLLMKRAQHFSDSRLICDVQWQSDVEAGRTVGQAVVAQLREEKEFQADLAAAKAEVAEAQRSGSSPPVGCSAEAAALRDRRAAG